MIVIATVAKVRMNLNFKIESRNRCRLQGNSISIMEVEFPMAEVKYVHLTT